MEKYISKYKSINNYNKTLSALLEENNIHIKDDKDFNKIFPDQNIKITTGIEFLNSIDILNNSDKFVNKLIDFDKTNEICIACDYDGDGIFACVIMQFALQQLGYSVHFIVPNRLDDGYGMKEEKIIEDIKTNNTKLIITVDNGIGSYDIVEKLKELNVETIITDHHLPDNEKIPDTLIIDPKYNNDEFSDICGAFVALKLVYSLYRKAAPTKMNVIEDLIPFAGMATITDMMPVLYENRQLIKYTLNKINLIKYETCHPLYKIISSFSGQNFLKNQNEIATEELISFYIGPNINAISRVNGDSSEMINRIINVLNNPYGFVPSYREVNYKRQKMSTELFNDFVYDENYKNSIVFVFDENNYDFKIKGILGLIANKVSNKYHLTTLIGTYKDDKSEIEFSGRSILNYNLYNGMERISREHPELELNFGGHAQAMGIKIKNTEENLKILKETLDSDIANNLEDYETNIFIWEPDYENEIIETLGTFQPYGAKFSKLKFKYSGTFYAYHSETKTAEIGDYIFKAFLSDEEIKNMKSKESPIDVIFTINFNNIDGPTFILNKD